MFLALLLIVRMQGGATAKVTNITVQVLALSWRVFTVAVALGIRTQLPLAVVLLVLLVERVKYFRVALGLREGLRNEFGRFHPLLGL